jgi:ABC-type dipeptide/oligopeptide/nickel transport system permease component
MARIVLPRLIQLGFTLLGVFIVLFVITRLSGDPVALLLGPSATTESIAQLRSAMGLDRPLWAQFTGELLGAMRLDFGVSLRGGQDALTLALGHLAVSLQLVAGALAFAVALAVPVGVIAAVPVDVRRLRRASGADLLQRAAADSIVRCLLAYAADVGLG